MIPKQHTGKGFKGVSDYLLHDKKAKTRERVEWTHSENLAREAPDFAWREMVGTAKHAGELKRDFGAASCGRKAARPVYHLSLSWATDEAPSREEMIEAGRGALAAIGMDRHQALFVCHNDEPHPHIHILASRVDPETGMMNPLPHSKRRLSEWALSFEREQGQIRCKLRAENNRALARGEKPRYDDPVIQRAWQRSDTGAAFAGALADEGYTLARGNKRLVVVDPHGKAINPARELHGVRVADIKARLADLDLARLPSVEEVQARLAGNERDEGEAARSAKSAARRPADKAAKHPARSEDSSRNDVPKEPPAVETREEDNVRPEQGTVEAASRKEETREAREHFGEAAKPPARAEETSRGEFPEHPPEFETLEEYNARWEQSIIEAAIRKEETRAAREHFDEAAKSPARAEETSRGEFPEHSPEFETLEEYNARWEQSIIEAAIRKEETRAARERFGEAAKPPARAEETSRGEFPEHSPKFETLEEYNARWEQSIIEAAIRKEETRAGARERIGKTAKSPARSGDSSRGHFPKEKPARDPANDNVRRAELQSKHIDEQVELGRSQDRRRLDREEQLAEFYDTSRDRETLRELEGKRWLFGGDRQRIEDLYKNIADAERRAEEARVAQRLAFERENAGLARSQERERAELELRLVEQAPEQAREQTASAAREAAHAPAPGGRERSR